MRRRLCFLFVFLMLCTVTTFADDTDAGAINSIINLSKDAGVNTDDALNKLEFYVVNNHKQTDGYFTCEVRAKSTASGDVTVPGMVTDVAKHQFKVIRAQRFGDQFANKITKVTFSENLQWIMDQCFERASELKEVVIPSTVTRIGASVFTNTPKLENININSNNTSFKVDNGALFSYDGTTLYAYLTTNTNKNYTIPKTVTHIIKGAISYNPYLESVTISENVSQIDFPAIYCDANMTDITVDGNNSTYASVDGILTDKKTSQILTFPFHKGYDKSNNTQNYTIPGGRNITTIGTNAFLNCSDLQSITLAEGVTTIEDQAFSSCEKLTTITLPSTVATINGDPFPRCSQLKEIKVKEGNSKFADIDGVLTSSNKGTIIRYPYGKNYSKTGIVYDIPDGVTAIGANAFKEINLTEITIPSRVTSIGHDAFSNCPSLAKVTFEDDCKITEIQNNVFFGCKALKEITIPSSVTKIDNSAFYQSGLETVHVSGKGLTLIDQSAFSGNTNLKEFIFDDSDCPLETIGKEAFKNCTSLESFTFPKTIKTLSGSSFQGCTSLQNITFAKDAALTSLGASVFNGCTNLESVTLPDKLETIGNLAFSHCGKLDNMRIPASVTSIATQAFEYCYGLNNFEVDKDNTVYSQVDGMLTTGGTGKNETLYIMPPGRAHSDYTLLPTIKKIGSQACYQNMNLTNIAIPSSVEEIDKSAFEGCTNLKFVTCFGEKAPKLDDGAFYNSLTSDAVLFYRKKDEVTYSNWGTFAARQPSFNYGYRDESAGRKENVNDLVEYLPLSSEAAAVVSNASVTPDANGNYASSTKTTLIIPEKVSDEFNGVTYSYTTKVVYDNAFQSNSHLKTLTFLGPITYIGVNAFPAVGNGGNNEGIFFVNDFPTKEGIQFAQDKYNLGAGYESFANKEQLVYVKESQREAYDKAFNNENGYHPCVVKSDIPAATGTKVDPFGHYLSTLCREFAIEFTGGSTYVPYITIPNSYKVETDKTKGYSATVKAYRAEVVPAFKGAIIRNTSETNTPSFYRIAETQTSDDNGEELIKGVYEDTQIDATDGDKTNFIMNGGIFKPTKAGTIGAFKSYLSLAVPTSSTGAKLSVLFVDGGTTGISDIVDTVNIENSPVYDLSGRKVADSYNEVKANSSIPGGIYIVNGKKLVIK